MNDALVSDYIGIGTCLVGIVAMLAICIMTNLAIAPTDGKPHPITRLVAMSGILIVISLSCVMIGFTIDALGFLASSASGFEDAPAVVTRESIQRLLADSVYEARPTN